MGVGIAEGVGVGVGVGVGSTGLKTGFNSGFAAAFTDTPLFHTNLLPDLTQVYFIPAEVLVCPCFAHLVPGFTVAFAKGVTVARKSALAAKSATFLRIQQLCGTKALCSSGAIAFFPSRPQESPPLNLENPF